MLFLFDLEHSTAGADASSRPGLAGFIPALYPYICRLLLQILQYEPETSLLVLSGADPGF